MVGVLKIKFGEKGKRGRGRGGSVLDFRDQILALIFNVSIQPLAFSFFAKNIAFLTYLSNLLFLM